MVEDLGGGSSGGGFVEVGKKRVNFLKKIMK